MSTTAESIVTQALGLSLRNRQDSVATMTTELLLVIQRAMQELFADAATFYPEYFGTRDVVAYSTPAGGWARPSRALAMYRIETTAGDEVVVVQDRDRGAERFKPIVVERGRLLLPGSTAQGPSIGAPLVIYYARSPVGLTPGTLAQSIDSIFPDEYVPYLVYSVALYLAQKDQRADEIDLLGAQSMSWRQLWQRYLQEATLNTRHRWAPRQTDAPGTQITTKPAT